MQLTAMFPDEDAATTWFEALVWLNGRHCPRCGCTDTREAARTTGLPYYCTSCRKTFSVRIGTALERSKVTFRQWVFAIYLEVTSLKVVSSMKMTGSFINIRAGPCTDYEILGQVQEGHRLHLMGRNASENQLFAEHPTDRFASVGCSAP
ncbi:MAG: transposase [Caldilineaceae bacterium SB0664_bin_22]|nr:transposase [Caldilineaceae bacterium SB0664_bin_22]